MPTITVSESLYRQIVDEADGDDAESIDVAMWKMVGSFRRASNPGD